jgi:hypothetical protein
LNPSKRDSFKPHHLFSSVAKINPIEGIRLEHNKKFILSNDVADGNFLTKELYAVIVIFYVGIILGLVIINLG